MSLPHQMDRMPKIPAHRMEQYNVPPPKYSAQYPQYSQGKQYSAWDPRGWSKAVKIGAAVAVVLVIVAAIVGGVLGSKASSYPNYSQLTYKLVDTYSGESFFDNFDYYTGYDPAAGFVHYVDSASAATLNITYASSSSAILQVDTSDKDATTGRKSARITSKKQYDSGLFIFDIVRTPYGCSLWPALWLSDPNNWPENGEIDIMETVNYGNAGTHDYIGNQATLHTSDDCNMKGKRKMEAISTQTDCHNTTNSNAGCGALSDGTVATYGEPYNAVGGGVYAMELRSAGIRVWSWVRDSLPSDIQEVLSSNGTSTNTPDPSGWGTAFADFPNTHCDIDSHFTNQSIIADIDFCGSWAASTEYYTTVASCPGDCYSYVATGNFTNAVWEWGGWWVYQAE